MSAMEDIFEDGREPKPREVARIFEMRVPGHGHRHWACVEVDAKNDGHCELAGWRWGEHRPIHGGYRLTEPKHKAAWDAMREVWEWLAEWGLVELRQIGPDDSEYFAVEGGGLDAQSSKFAAAVRDFMAELRAGNEALELDEAIGEPTVVFAGRRVRHRDALRLLRRTGRCPGVGGAEHEKDVNRGNPEGEPGWTARVVPIFRAEARR